MNGVRRTQRNHTEPGASVTSASAARVLAAALAVAFTVALAGCADPVELPRLAANNWPGYWPLYLAERTAAEPFARITELHSATEVMRAFRNGAVDIAALTLDEAVQLATESGDVCAFLVVDASAGGDALLAQDGFADVDALRGRRVGVEASALGAYMLARIGDLTALDPAAIEIVELPYGDHERAFADGRVDALVTFEPVRSRLLAGGARELFSSRDIPGEIVDVLVSHCDYLEQHARQLGVLVSRWEAAVAALHERPDEAWRELGGFAGGDRDGFVQALAGIEFPDAAAQRDYQGGALAARAASLAATMREHALLPTQPRGELVASSRAWDARP
ncbi:MAG: ABC transporter substrate-binding protein [Gammaproteobacteria bacterium]